MVGVGSNAGQAAEVVARCVVVSVEWFGPRQRHSRGGDVRDCPRMSAFWVFIGVAGFAICLGPGCRSSHKGRVCRLG